MVKLEERSRRRRRIGTVQQAILGTIAVTGVVLIAAVAPKALQLLGGSRNKYRFGNQAKTALSRLAQKGYIIFIEDQGKRFARITPLGQHKLALEEKRLLLHKKSRWDKRWRVVIFDVPEIRRGVRDSLRNTMRECGFYRLQDSVWLFPYECEEFIALLKAELKIGNAVVYMIVDTIENDSRIREFFNFKKV